MWEWDEIVVNKRGLLLRIAAYLFSLAGMADAKPVATLERRVYRAIFPILRPAESALRRLIIMAARKMMNLVHRPGKAAPPFLRPRGESTVLRSKTGEGETGRGGAPRAMLHKH